MTLVSDVVPSTFSGVNSLLMWFFISWLKHCSFRQSLSPLRIWRNSVIQCIHTGCLRKDQMRSWFVFPQSTSRTKENRTVRKTILLSSFGLFCCCRFLFLCLFVSFFFFFSLFIAFIHSFSMCLLLFLFVFLSCYYFLSRHAEKCWCSSFQ